MRLALLIALLLTPVFAQEGGHKAAEGKSASHEGGESHALPLGWMWANFLILGGGLGYLISKNAGPFFRSRTEEIQSELKEARKLSADSEARAAAIATKVSNLQSEMQALRDNARTEMEAEGHRIEQETARVIAKIRAGAENEIAFASKVAQQELKAFSGELAVKLAAGNIRERLTPSKQEELAEGFVQQLASSQKVTH
ncbi:MAG: hypothetical protein HY820_11530 [Acidobacteria bacterium]|nr:hypothetical protein [Acidobacteriota bacterium]